MTTTAAVTRDEIEATIDLLPTGVLLIEPSTARVTFANRAAHRMAGGEFPIGSVAERYDRYHFTDPSGRVIQRDAMPSVRAARGEQLEGFQMNWHQPDRVIALLIRTTTAAAADGDPFAVLAFEDVTELERVQAADEQSIAQLDSLFATAPLGRAFFDRELRYVRINEALAQINGVSVQEHIGRTPYDVVPHIGVAVTNDLRRVIEGGEPLVDVELSGRTAASPKQPRHWRVNYFPVRNGSGDILGAGCIVIDETDRVALLESERRARERAERAEQRASLLARVGELLGSSLDYEETLRGVARAAVPQKADWCVVDMLQEDGTLKRLAACHTDPAKEGWVGELHDRYPPEAVSQRRGVLAVVRSGEPKLYRSISDELLQSSAQDSQDLQMLRELGVSSAIVAPLVVRDRPVGAITFSLAESGRTYGQDDLELAGEIARRASLAIEQARLYRERSHIARTLQRSLLPGRMPEIEGVELAARHEAAGGGYEVGGDFYDVFRTGDGRWAMVLGDVCGKGPEAAALTSLARYTIRAGALVKSGPATVLGMANDVILGEHLKGNFVSAVHLWLGPGARTLLLAGAGHPPVLVVRGDGSVESIKPLGTLLGVDRSAVYQVEAVALEAGDLVLLYTDGVLDAGSPDNVMEPEDLEAIAARAAGGSAADLAQLVEFEALASARGQPRDDLAILALRRL